MKFVETAFDGLFVIETLPFRDHRGRFVRVFCKRAMTKIRPETRFNQINLSSTLKAGSVRGMHYQIPPKAECKVIRCVRGSVWDVVVDVRKGSPTFLAHHAIELSAENGRQLFVPEGFAHGFQALEPESELLYLHTVEWSRRHERRLRHDDPAIGIEWPMPVSDVSEKDLEAKILNPEFEGVKFSGISQQRDRNLQAC